MRGRVQNQTKERQGRARARNKEKEGETKRDMSAARYRPQLGTGAPVETPLTAGQPAPHPGPAPLKGLADGTISRAASLSESDSIDSEVVASLVHLENEEYLR